VRFSSGSRIRVLVEEAGAEVGVAAQLQLQIIVVGGEGRRSGQNQSRRSEKKFTHSLVSQVNCR